MNVWRDLNQISELSLNILGSGKLQEGSASGSKVKGDSARVGLRQCLRTSDGGQIVLPFRYETNLPNQRTKEHR